MLAALQLAHGSSALGCHPTSIHEMVRVNYVYDGDTLQLEDGRRLRLIGIDTPELSAKGGFYRASLQQAAEEARGALQGLLNRSDGRIGIHIGDESKDRYGRTLAHVYLADGTNVQAWMLEQGFAIAFTTPPNDRMSQCYQQHEANARDKNNKGIWQLPEYQLKLLHELHINSRGFHRLQGKVSEVRRYANRITIYMGNVLKLNLFKQDWHNFNMHQLQTLQHKTIHIRGWLYPSQSKPGKQYGTMNFNMALRHADALKVIH